MKVVLYLSGAGEAGKTLREAVEAMVPSEWLALCRSPEDLSRCLLRPTFDLSAVVLPTTSSKNLADILTLRESMRGLRVLLVLPDSTPHTVAQGHTLHPRLLTTTDCNFTELVVAVLKKILGISEEIRTRTEWRDIRDEKWV
jgi:hypothetical protein